MQFTTCQSNCAKSDNNNCDNVGTSTSHLFMYDFNHFEHILMSSILSMCPKLRHIICVRAKSPTLMKNSHIKVRTHEQREQVLQTSNWPTGLDKRTEQETPKLTTCYCCSLTTIIVLAVHPIYASILPSLGACELLQHHEAKQLFCELYLATFSYLES